MIYDSNSQHHSVLGKECQESQVREPADETVRNAISERDSMKRHVNEKEFAARHRPARACRKNVDDARNEQKLCQWIAKGNPDVNNALMNSGISKG